MTEEEIGALEDRCYDLESDLKTAEQERDHAEWKGEELEAKLREVEEELHEARKKCHNLQDKVDELEYQNKIFHEDWCSCANPTRFIIFKEPSGWADRLMTQAHALQEWCFDNGIEGGFNIIFSFVDSFFEAQFGDEYDAHQVGMQFEKEVFDTALLSR